MAETTITWLPVNIQSLIVLKQCDLHMRIITQNTRCRTRKCILGVLVTLNHFWANGVPKTPKYSREIGIFHVKLKTPITQKRRHIEKKLLNFTIAYRGSLSESAIFVYIWRHLAAESAITWFPVNIQSLIVLKQCDLHRRVITQNTRCSARNCISAVLVI